jgi:CHASE2 domain-containing sensor protein
MKIAQSYLKEEFKSSSNQIQLGSVNLERFTANTGGYQLPQIFAAGFQILVNYRSINPKQVSLTEIISGARDAKIADLVKDRIILIGRDRYIGHAYSTPYSKSEKVSSTMIHAQMSSQLISAVLDDRSLLRGIPQWSENILIIFGVLIGGFLAQWQYTKLYKFIFLFMVSALLLFFSYQGLLWGFWIPILPVIFGLFLTPILIFSVFTSTRH